MMFGLLVALAALAIIFSILLIAVLGGRAMHLGGPYPEQPDDDFEPLPRQLNPHVPSQWQHRNDDLRDLDARDTPTPSDPAS